MAECVSAHSPRRNGLADKKTDGVSSFPSDKLPLTNRTAQTTDGKRLQTLEDVKAVGTGYTAMFEVFHQLHCLVSLWRPIGASFDTFLGSLSNAY